MNDDLFSQLFELFNQPGPINWKLAREVVHHFAKTYQPVEPWVAEELRELARLAEYRVEQVSPFPVPTASDVVPLDRLAWGQQNLENYVSLVEPFASSVGVDSPAAPLLSQLAPAIIGLQVGLLVGSLSLWAVAGFDAGLPPDKEGPMLVSVNNMDALAAEGVDMREQHLWVVTNEVAFRTMTRLPWIHDHLSLMVQQYADAARIDPTQLSGLMMGGTDPADIQRAIEEAGGLDALVGGEDAAGPRAELEAFLGALTGCARLLARRAIVEMAPSFDYICDSRDAVRVDPDRPPIGIGPVDPELTQLGDVFNQEVERRYGDEALQTLWADPTRMPSATELRDPTSWAARVLLDGWTT